MSRADGMPSDRSPGDAPRRVVEVDARGLRCPLPVIELARALGAVPAGQLVRLLATDPAARTDVAAFCRLRGAELVQVSEHRDAGELGNVREHSQAGEQSPGPGGHTAYLVRQVSATAPEGAPAAPP